MSSLILDQLLPFHAPGPFLDDHFSVLGMDPPHSNPQLTSQLKSQFPPQPRSQPPFEFPHRAPPDRAPQPPAPPPPQPAPQSAPQLPPELRPNFSVQSSAPAAPAALHAEPPVRPAAPHAEQPVRPVAASLGVAGGGIQKGEASKRSLPPRFPHERPAAQQQFPTLRVPRGGADGGGAPGASGEMKSLRVSQLRFMSGLLRSLADDMESASGDDVAPQLRRQVRLVSHFSSLFVGQMRQLKAHRATPARAADPQTSSSGAGASDPDRLRAADTQRRDACQESRPAQGSADGVGVDPSLFNMAALNNPALQSALPNAREQVEKAPAGQSLAQLSTAQVMAFLELEKIQTPTNQSSSPPP